jgi:hypothetical protein
MVINLEDFYLTREVAVIISRNSKRKISHDYVRRLVATGVLTPVNIGGVNLYPREEAERVVVREKGSRLAHSQGNKSA